MKVSVEHHFSLQNYSTTEIVKWVKWFCGTHGSPVFYETPISQGGIWDADDPNYKVKSFHFRFSSFSFFIQKPHGFLKSKFLISIGSWFLQDSQNMVFNFGPPRGLFVLILTAVSDSLNSCGSFECSQSSLQYEKVIQSYQTGVYVPRGNFCAKSCNMWVRQYNKNFNKTANWWKSILECYIIMPNSDHKMIGELSILDEGRGYLPMSSSP